MITTMRVADSAVDQARSFAAEVEQRVAEQEERIVRLRWEGADTRDAVRVLDELNNTYRAALAEVARMESTNRPTGP